MSHSYSCCLVHYVFSTKGRRKLIPRDVRDRLWPYIGGIARTNDMTARAVGGTDDHIHVLVSLPATMSIAKAAQLLKGGSSKWVHDSFPSMTSFAWQEGYGAFTIGRSGMDATIAYIRNQEEHHRTRTFEEEFTAFLEKYEIEYDTRYVFG